MSTKNQMEQPPPSVAEMVRIALGLTTVCLIAAIILAVFYYITEPAKAKNIQAREQQLITELLGLSENAQVHEIRRYLRWQESKLQVIYLMPTMLLTMDDQGNEMARVDVPDEIRTTSSTDAKDSWVKDTLQATEIERFKFAGRFFLGRDNDRLAGYVVEGLTPGYKTWIRFFLAIDSEFRLRGMEVIAHEEDPGLGAEITERYFKNQFAGRDFEAIAAIKVTKDPLPSAWKDSLKELGDTPFAPWFELHAPKLLQYPDIHAITGATISSVAVTNGIQKALRNFRKRLQTVEQQL